MNTKTKLVMLELIGGIFGWIWLISSLAGIYFFISALFFEGLWTSFFWAFGASAVAKWLARGFEANKKELLLKPQKFPIENLLMELEIRLLLLLQKR